MLSPNIFYETPFFEGVSSFVVAEKPCWFMKNILEKIENETKV